MESLLIWGIALLAAALLVVLVEVFLPSAGALAALSAALAVAGVICLFKVDWRWGAAGSLAMLILGPLIFYFGLQMMPSTPFGRKLLFGEEGKNEPVLPEDLSNALESLIGAEGECLTDLRPVGAVRIEGERYDALSDAAFIPAGTRVRVTAVDGAQVKVRRVG